MKSPPLRLLTFILLAAGVSAPAASKWPEFDRAAEFASTTQQILPKNSP